jgi:hypothetical protein
MQILKIALEVCLIGLARHAVGAGCGVLLELAERFGQHFGSDVVKERGEPLRPSLPCCLPYALQRL